MKIDNILSTKGVIFTPRKKPDPTTFLGKVKEKEESDKFVPQAEIISEAEYDRQNANKGFQ